MSVDERAGRSRHHRWRNTVKCVVGWIKGADPLKPRSVSVAISFMATLTRAFILQTTMRHSLPFKPTIGSHGQIRHAVSDHKRVDCAAERSTLDLISVDLGQKYVHGHVLGTENIIECIPDFMNQAHVYSAPENGCGMLNTSRNRIEIHY